MEINRRAMLLKLSILKKKLHLTRIINLVRKKTRLLNVLDEERNEKKKLKAQATKNKRELAAKCIRAKKELEEIKKARSL